MITVTHATPATLPNDPAKEVSSDAWNEGHTVAGLGTAAEADVGDFAPASLTLAAIIDALYPVGSLYTSTLTTNPGTLLGVGTWSAFGAGRVMVGQDAGDTDFDASEETGGAKTVTSTGSVSAPTFTGNALAAHAHTAGTYATDAHAGTGVSAHAGTAVSAHAGTAVADHAAHTHTTTATGTVSQPTFTGNAVAAASTAATPDLLTTNTASTGVSPVTTATGTVSTPTFTGNAVASGNPSATLTHAVTQPSAHTVTQPDNHTVTQPNNHTISGSSQSITAGTPSGSNSAPTYTGNATSVVQPYIVVFMWKRTA